MKNSRVALGSTSFKPARKSSRVTCSAPSSSRAAPSVSSGYADRKPRRAIMPTSCPSASRSAPTNPCECSAISLQIDVGRERHGARVDSKNLQPRLRVRNADFDFAIEAARTPQRGIEHLGNIRRADDDDLAARHEAIHQAEKLRHDALFDFAS